MTAAQFEVVEDIHLEPVGDDGYANLDSVRQYLNALRETPLLNAFEEVELAKRIEAGLFAGELLQARQRHMEHIPPVDTLQAMLAKIALAPTSPADEDLADLRVDGERAKDHLIRANLRLVANMAKRYTGRGVPYLDIIQEGNIGLVRAVEKFDYTKGFKFSTYATWWIRQAITSTLPEQSRTIRLPVHFAEKVNKCVRVRRELSAQLGREPTNAEVAAEMDIPPEKAEELQAYARDPISLDQPAGVEGKRTLGDFIADDDAFDPVQAAIYTSDVLLLERLLADLSDREREVITLRKGTGEGDEPMKLGEIAALYGVSRERIRQIEKRAMRKLMKAAGVEVSAVSSE